jgi:peroxiredoxin (alkyl hydroperoxide reductase subunit C)
MNNARKAPPAVGKPAPDFSLPATGRDAVTLKDGEHGRLLYVFPAAFTPAAALDLSTLELRAKEIRDRGFEIIGLSVDSVWANQIFSASLGGLSFPLAADLTRKTLEAYGLLNEDGTAVRALVVTNPDGTVKSFRTLKPDEPLPADLV